MLWGQDSGLNAVADPGEGPAPYSKINLRLGLKGQKNTFLQLAPLSSQGLDDFPRPLSKGLDQPLKCTIFSPIKAIP